MRFDKAAILGLDDKQFSPAEKKYLIEKFFPGNVGKTWQHELGSPWLDLRRWQRFLGSDIGEIGTAPYRYTHEWLLAVAKQSKLKNIGNRVSNFSGWVFSLYRPRPEKVDLANGQRVERAVARLAPLPSNKEWELIYEDPLSNDREVKTISGLTVRGQPLRGVPDVVFREKATGRILIVERKASNRKIPSDGWPNLRAQLWAYAQIDDWLNAPDVLLVGEIWGFTINNVYPRAVCSWVRGEPKFEHENSQLFELYRAENA